jgi:hypothetical protein
MDIDSRSFIDVMKDLSSQTGIELPKDNRDSKKLPNKPKLHFCQSALPPSQCFHFYPLPAKKQFPFSKRKRAGQTCSFYILFKNNNCSLNVKIRH